MCDCNSLINKRNTKITYYEPYSALYKLPDFVKEYTFGKIYETDEDKMQLAIELSARNIRIKQGGGPFAACVFDENDRLVSIGTNSVVRESGSMCHAEIMAYMIAQKKIGHYRLNGMTLASSAQPCIMCFGATCWTSISKLITGARASDTEFYTGFNEGPIPSNWIEELNKFDIEVVSDVLRDEAVEVLKEYSGTLY